jgi:hypothetical protein
MYLSLLVSYAAFACPGDCNGDNQVTVAELVLGASIALGNTSPGQCSALDADRNGQVTVNEVMAATGAALNGCGALAVSSATLCFTGLVGAELPSQAITVQSAKGQWQAAADVPWLTVSPTQGQAPADIQVTPQNVGLPDGSSTGQVLVTDAVGNKVTVQVALSLYSPGRTANWKLQTVEAVGSAGQTTSLALDPSGQPAITFDKLDSVTGLQLRYTHRSGCLWESEGIERFGTDSSLVFDSTGQPRISFFGGGKRVLRYAARSSQGWNIITVEDQGSSGDTGHRSSLALDAADVPHISYLLKFATGDIYTYNLRYANLDASTWGLQTVDTQTGSGWDTSLALSPKGEPRISYHTDPTYSLQYAELLDGQWSITRIDKGGRPSSLRLDSSGQPKIAHHDGGKGQALRFAYRVNGVWQAETVDTQGVDPAGGDRAFASLALDKADRPHIAYVDFGTGALKYASRGSDGTWTIDVLDTGPNVGNYCALQIDHNNVAHISYLDLTDGTLKYAEGPASR